MSFEEKNAFLKKWIAKRGLKRNRPNAIFLWAPFEQKWAYIYIHCRLLGKIYGKKFTIRV